MRTVDTIREWSHHYDNDWNVNGKEIVTRFATGPNGPTGPTDGVNVGEAWRELADQIEEEIATDYMRLPVDAYGEAWHPNDAFMVDGVLQHVAGISERTIYYYDPVTDKVEWTQAATNCHYRPTVGKLLREYRKKAVDISVDYIGHSMTYKERCAAMDALDAEYAAKLRLAEDDAE